MKDEEINVEKTFGFSILHWDIEHYSIPGLKGVKMRSEEVLFRLTGTEGLLLDPLPMVAKRVGKVEGAGRLVDVEVTQKFEHMRQMCRFASLTEPLMWAHGCGNDEDISTLTREAQRIAEEIITCATPQQEAFFRRHLDEEILEEFFAVRSVAV